MGCWGWGSLRDLSKKILKQGGSRQKLYVGVTTPVPPENFNYTLGAFSMGGGGGFGGTVLEG